MPNLVVLNGMNGYKDSNADIDVISYVLNSPYLNDYTVGNLVDLTCNPRSLALQFQLCQSIRPETKKKLTHFILSLDDANFFPEEIDQIMQMVRDYFAAMGFQILLGYHYGSKKSSYHPHIHVVLNRISQSGQIFYGNNTNYCDVLKMLRTHTGLAWRYIYKDFDDMDF